MLTPYLCSQYYYEGFEVYQMKCVYFLSRLITSLVYTNSENYRLYCNKAWHPQWVVRSYHKSLYYCKTNELTLKLSYDFEIHLGVTN